MGKAPDSGEAGGAPGKHHLWAEHLDHGKPGQKANICLYSPSTHRPRASEPAPLSKDKGIWGEGQTQDAGTQQNNLKYLPQ